MLRPVNFFVNLALVFLSVLVLAGVADHQLWTAVAFGVLFGVSVVGSALDLIFRIEKRRNDEKGKGNATPKTP